MAGTGALFVRVSAESTPTFERTFEIWIVATDDPVTAEKAVRELVSSHRSVEVIHDLPSEETVRRLALLPREGLASLTTKPKSNSLRMRTDG